MAMRKRTNKRGKTIRNKRGKELKSGKFTRKGTKQIYRKGGCRTSFPNHNIISSERPDASTAVGVECWKEDGTGWSESCGDTGVTTQDCQQLIDECRESGGGYVASLIH